MEDNNKKDPSLMVDEWLKEIMAKLDLPDQSETKTGDLGADEHAIASAGLTHPDDMELEKIVQETLAENWGEPETEPETEPEPHPKKLSEEIASALSVRTNSEAFCYGKSDGGYTVKIPQIISGIELFDCSIEIKISESGSVIAHGSYLCDGEITTYSDKVSTVSAVMLSFADAVKEKGFSGINVSDVRVGYMAKASDSKRVSLAPAIGIETDSGLFLVDMQTEKVYVE